jgi:hypothetical protein
MPLPNLLLSALLKNASSEASSGTLLLGIAAAAVVSLPILAGLGCIFGGTRSIRGIAGLAMLIGLVAFLFGFPLRGLGQIDSRDALGDAEHAGRILSGPFTVERVAGAGYPGSYQLIAYSHAGAPADSIFLTQDKLNSMREALAQSGNQSWQSWQIAFHNVMH